VAKHSRCAIEPADSADCKNHTDPQNTKSNNQNPIQQPTYGKSSNRKYDNNPNRYEECLPPAYTFQLQIIRLRGFPALIRNERHSRYGLGDPSLNWRR
jgi:hypothetical protein